MKEVAVHLSTIFTRDLITIGLTVGNIAVIHGLFFLFKSIFNSKKRKANETGFGSYLCKFSSFCDMHYRYAIMKLHGYTDKKGNEFDGKSITLDGRQDIAHIDPETLFRENQSLLSGRHAARNTTRMIDTLYQLRAANHDMDHFLSSFHDTYQEVLKGYYSNVYELGRLYDELRKYVKGKSLNKSAGEWMQCFFAIFDEWTRNGKNSDMMTLQNEIVLKVVELNKRYTVSPFSNRSSDRASSCRQAFQQIEELDAGIRKRFNHYIWIYRKAAKITWLIGRSIIPAAHREAVSRNPQLIVVKQPGVKEKMAITAGLILFGAMGFFGGMYLSDKQHPSPSEQKLYIQNRAEEPRTVKADIGTPDKSNKNELGHFDSLLTIYGLDIARYQGDLLKDIQNFDSIHFVICKATQGTTLIDVDFNYNWQRLKELHITRGAYHFYVAKDDPIEQAQHFLRTVDTLAGSDIPLVLDIEELSLNDSISPATLQFRLLTFLSYIEKNTGRTPLIYTDLSFANTWLRQEEFASYPLWLAEYSGRRSPIVPEIWKKRGIAFWQKTDSFRINSTRTDFDVFNGDGSAFVSFVNNSAPANVIQ